MSEIDDDSQAGPDDYSDDPVDGSDIEDASGSLSGSEDDSSISGSQITEKTTDVIMSKKSDGDLKVDPSKRITPTFMTKYEKARVIGTRALQISRQAPIMVDLGPGKPTHISPSSPAQPIEDKDPIKIAERELRDGKLPFVIRRHLPDGTYEDWDVNEL